ncbi:MAG TPA: hypothetical protein PK449_07750, partial [Exilispira sp.]|nr:hypothetical protein [Exilispira sp.]
MQIKKSNRILIIIIVAIVILFGIALGSLFASFKNTDIKQAINDLEFALPTNIYDRNGELIAQLSIEQREIIPLKD